MDSVLLIALVLAYFGFLFWKATTEHKAMLRSKYPPYPDPLTEAERQDQ